MSIPFKIKNIMEILLYRNFYKLPLSQKKLSLQAVQFNLNNSVDTKVLEIFFLMEFFVNKKLLFPFFNIIKNPYVYKGVPKTYISLCKQVPSFLFFICLVHYSTTVSFSSFEVTSRFYERLGFPSEMFSLSFKIQQ